jgi:hypothetical protein
LIPGVILPTVAQAKSAEIPVESLCSASQDPGIEAC